MKDLFKENYLAIGSLLLGEKLLENAPSHCVSLWFLTIFQQFGGTSTNKFLIITRSKKKQIRSTTKKTDRPKSQIERREFKIVRIVIQTQTYYTHTRAPVYSFVIMSSLIFSYSDSLKFEIVESLGCQATTTTLATSQPVNQRTPFYYYNSSPQSLQLAAFIC